MRKLVLLTALLLAAAPAWAADNYQVKDANSATVTIKAKDTGGGVESPQVVPSDANGAPVTSAPSTNPAQGIAIQGLLNGHPVEVDVSNGVTQGGVWTTQVGNTPNTVPILATVNQGGNSAIVAAGASPYGAALAVAGGITPAAAISSAPLSSPILAAVTTLGGTSYVPGQLNIPVMTSPGRLAVDYSGIAVSSTVSSGTTGAANIFQTVLPASATRQGCLVQNNGSGNAFIYVGSLAAATTPKSFQIVPQGTFDCAHGAIVLSDTINIAAAVSSAFIAVSQ